MKNIVIFGAPGAGKGTQSDKMIEKYGLGHISTGDVLRNEIKNGTELGKTAKGYIDNGQLIPDELMIDILASVYDSFGKDHAGVIFDGFPRTTPQAEALKKMLSERGHKIAAMIELAVPEDELMARLINAVRKAAVRMIMRRLSRSVSMFIIHRLLRSSTGMRRKAFITTSRVSVTVDEIFARVCNVIDNL